MAKEKNMGMKLTGKDRIWGLAMAGVMMSFWIWGFQGSRPLIMLAIIPALLLVFDLAVPSKYQPYLLTSIIVLMAGVLAGVSLEKLFGDIPYIRWAVYTWPAIAVAVGILRPFPVLKRYFFFLKTTAASDAAKKEGRENGGSTGPRLFPFSFVEWQARLASALPTCSASMVPMYTDPVGCLKS